VIRPHIIYRDALLCVAMLALPIVVFAALPPGFWHWLFIPPAALWLGFWLHSYTLYLHEAAHFNIHPDKKKNDLLSDIFITPFAGMLVRDYRVSHWQHHLFLGQANDTETSYRTSVNLRQAVAGLTGIYLLKTALRYSRNFNTIDQKVRDGAASRSVTFLISLALMAAVQGAICLLLWYFISFPAGAAWAGAVLVVYPFLAQLRQTLEHRDLNAAKGTDYSVVEHGPVNRMFGPGFFSRYFGGAGFDRHLLHHYDPSISYTRFDELEKYFMGTELAPGIDKSRATYWKTFITLARQP
jgi:fatty acid desaturase